MGMLVKRALMSKDTKLSSAAMLCSFMDLANPLLPLTKKNLLLHIQGQSYLSLGTSVTAVFSASGEILPTTPRNCNGIPFISSHEEYFEQIATGLECSICTHWWKKMWMMLSTEVERKKKTPTSSIQFSKSLHQIHNRNPWI